MMDDAQLLQRYANEGCEPAFSELVSRYLDLVFSAALRQVRGDAALAQDVTQLVFTAFARKAPTLSPSVVLGGWLYRHTCFVAAQAIRGERRRRVRERKAAEMSALNEPGEASWERLAPLLDGAMQRLCASDRNALILRFFQRHDLRAVGAALGLSEDAARMRVARAVEKLRKYFKGHGVTLSAATLACLLGNYAVGSAPVGLAASIIAPALAGAATAATGINLLTLKLMAMTNVKLGVAAAVVLTGLATPLLIQRHSLNQLRDENSALREQVHQFDTLRAENDRLKKAQVNDEEMGRLRKGQNELMRLRGEANLLREQLQLAEQSRPTPSKASPAGETNPLVTTYTSAVRATMGVSDTLVTGGWATKPGKRTLLFVTPEVLAAAGTSSMAAGGSAGQVVLHLKLADASEGVWASLGFQLPPSDSKENPLQQMLSPPQLKSLLQGLEQTPEVDMVSSPVVQTLDGRQANISIAQQRTLPGSTEPVTLGPVINLLPRVSQDGKMVDLSVDAQLTMLKDSPTSPPAGATLYPAQQNP